MNTHIHLLESITELYRAWPDELVKKRLAEMIEIVRDRIAVSPGCLNMYFTPDWRPVPAGDSFGHDIETAYLLIEAEDGTDHTTGGWPVGQRTFRIIRRHARGCSHDALRPEVGAVGLSLARITHTRRQRRG